MSGSIYTIKFSPAVSMLLFFFKYSNLIMLTALHALHYNIVDQKLDFKGILLFIHYYFCVIRTYITFITMETFSCNYNFLLLLQTFPLLPYTEGASVIFTQNQNTEGPVHPCRFTCFYWRKSKIIPALVHASCHRSSENLCALPLSVLHPFLSSMPNVYLDSDRYYYVSEIIVNARSAG